MGNNSLPEPFAGTAAGWTNPFEGNPMIPLYDNIPSRTTPWVNYLIVALTTLVFGLQLLDQYNDNRWQLVERFGMVPQRVLHPGTTVVMDVPQVVATPLGPRVVRVQKVIPPAAVPEWLTLLTCIFLHGGWMHFLGNMWFLYIFGDNVEDRLGHTGFLIFYLASGVLASAAHLAANPDSPVPTIGASGAIAGVMGAYFILYPKAQVVALIPLFFIFYSVVLPAPVFLGFWFFIQFFQGIGSITAGQSGGVAWWAHIGGFVVGMLVARSLIPTRLTRPPVTERRPGTERIGIYRYRPRYPMGP